MVVTKALVIMTFRLHVSVLKGIFSIKCKVVNEFEAYVAKG